MEWAYGLTLECWEYFSSSLLSIMSMDYAYMKSHVPVMVSITQVLLAVGWALLIGNLVFQALKSMAVGLGFEGEDPKLLFTRTFVFAFLLMASPQICEVGLSLTARIIELLEIPDAIDVTLVDEGAFGSLNAAWLLVIIFGLIIMFKVFRLLLEIAERYVILAVLTMTAPLAFAMGGSKSTSEIFGGWCRMFGSMCTLMVTNVIFFKMLLSVLSNVPSGLDIIPWIVLALTIVKVARKADAIITRIGLNPAITGDSLGRGFPGTLTYMVMRSATSHITKTIGKSTGKGNRGAASGSTTGGPRIGGGPSGAHSAAGHTASYQAYQASQQQNTSQGADGQGFVSQRESVQSGGAQTATQEHFSNSSMQNTSSIRQTAFRGAEARKSSVPSGMRRAPAYVTSVDRVSPSSAQTPAAGHDTSGNKTTSTVREQSNVTASIRTANSAWQSLSGNASQHEPAGRSPAPIRGFNMSVQVAVQSLSQWKEKYPRMEWENQLGSFDMTLYMGCNDMTSAEYFAKKCGKVTISVTNNQFPLAPLFSPIYSTTRPYSQTRSNTQRDLLQPDEFLRLDKFKCIVMFNHYKPAELYKIMLEELPAYKELVKCSVFDYVPEWKRRENENRKRTPQKTASVPHETSAGHSPQAAAHFVPQENTSEKKQAPDREKACTRKSHAVAMPRQKSGEQCIYDFSDMKEGTSPEDIGLVEMTRSAVIGEDESDLEELDDPSRIPPGRGI